VTLAVQILAGGTRLPTALRAHDWSAAFRVVVAACKVLTPPTPKPRFLGVAGPATQPTPEVVTVFLRSTAIALAVLAAPAPAEAARPAAATGGPTSMAGRFSVVCSYSNTRAVDPIMAFGHRPSPRLHDLIIGPRHATEA